MKRMVAIYKDKNGGDWKQMEQTDYSTKKEFAKELRANGFVVRDILTDEDLRAQNRGYHNAAAARDDAAQKLANYITAEDAPEDLKSDAHVSRLLGIVEMLNEEIRSKEGK